MSRTPEETRNLRIAREMYEKVLFPFDASLVERYISPTYRQHSALAPDGRQALKDFLVQARREYPHSKTEIKRELVDGDMVVFHVHVVLEPGTPGFAVADFFRLEDGLIAEHWDVIQPAATTTPHGNGIF
jgi:predicted SnoaL-like aldol condensation-catalyzing enzyme